MTTSIFTAEITLVVDDVGTEQTFYFASRGFSSKASDSPASTVFRPLLKNPGSLRRELFSGARVTGEVRPSFGEIELSNIDGALDDWMDYGVSGGRVIVRYGEYGAAYPAAFTTVFIAYANALTCDFKSVRVKMRDRGYLLDKPVVTAVFNGTGGIEGTGNTSKKKQLALGRPGYIPPIMVDANKLIYFVQANATDGVMLTSFYQGTVPVDGGVEISHAANYENEAELLSTSPDPGFFRMWGGQSEITTHATGPIYIRLGSPPEAEIRINPRGFLQNDPEELIRFWNTTDLCIRAGIDDADTNFATLAGYIEPSAGNRLIDGDQTYRDVLNDVSAVNFSSFGFTRLDQWFVTRLLDPSETGDGDSVKFNFTRNNSRDFSRAPVPGQESPVWQVNVSAGIAYPCQTLNGASNTLKDVLSRDPWQSRFTGTNEDVKIANPGAISEVLEIDANDFSGELEKQTFVNRYIQLYGTRRDLITLTCNQFDSTTLGLELMDKVTVTMDRFGCDSGRAFRIITISHNLRERNITFGLWGGDIGPAESDLGGGSSSDSSAGGTKKKAFAVGVLRMPPFTLQATATVSETAGMGTRGILQMPRFTLQAYSSNTAPTTNRVLLIHADGSSPTDDSSYARSITTVGGAVTSATQSKFGGKSLNIPGTSDYLTISDSADFVFGSDDWAIDFWVYPTTTPGASKIIAAHGNPSGAWAWALYLRSDLRLDFYHTRDGSTPYGGTMRSAVMSTGTWTHGHVARVGGTIRIGIAGAADATTSATGTTIYDPSVGLGIGAWNNGNESMATDIYIDEFSIVVGAHDIPGSGTFTPPTSAY